MTASSLNTASSIPSALMDLLLADDIQPGVPASYQICKTIYAYHPLGAKMAEAPIKLAQSQNRDIEIAGSPEEDLIKAYNAAWKKLNVDNLIKRTMATSRIYGAASIIMGAEGMPTDEPINPSDLPGLDLYFNIFDPLNTAGSITLNQDPNSPDYQRSSYVTAGDKTYHPSSVVTMFNEEPLYIEWTTSAFGFVGRSVYQRALYPLKSYVQSMITDDSVTQKAGLLVAKLKAPGSPIDQRSRTFFGFKREQIKGAKTGQVLSIGLDETVESIDLKNLKDAAEFARNNILKNIATSADMPASIINQETLASGFGEGSEDAKQIARYIDRLRIEMEPLYSFFDKIVQRIAWTEEFYGSIQKKYPEDYSGVSFVRAFTEWKNTFTAEWPNLLTEPDSEKIKVDEAIVNSGTFALSSLLPILDPENKARAAIWLTDTLNERKMMFSSPLILDEEAIAEYEPEESQDIEPGSSRPDLYTGKPVAGRRRGTK